MKRCIIVGAGSLYEGDLPVQKEEGDLLIAADGGYLPLTQSGATPDLLIGDFDSMVRPQTECEIITLPIEKDDTDLVYSVKEGFARGYREFVFYGGLGGKRLSHTLANLQLLAYIKQQGGNGVLMGGKTRVLLLHNETATLQAAKGAHCSLMAYDATAAVWATGLYYPLQNTTLSNRFPLGVSNHFIHDTVTLQVDGTLIVVIEE